MASERWLGSRKPAQVPQRPLISHQSIDQSNVLKPAQRAKMVVSSTQSLHSHSRTPLVPQSAPACSLQHHEKCLVSGRWFELMCWHACAKGPIPALCTFPIRLSTKGTGRTGVETTVPPASLEKQGVSTQKQKLRSSDSIF